MTLPLAMQVPLGLEPFPPINDHDVETRGGSGKRSLHPRQEMKAEQGVHSASASEFSEDRNSQTQRVQKEKTDRSGSATPLGKSNPWKKPTQSLHSLSQAGNTFSQTVGSAGGGERGTMHMRSDQQRKSDAADMGLFGAVNNLRKGQEANTNELLKFNNSYCGQLAADKRFELTTMVVISLNAIVIGYDADYTARWTRADGLYDGPAQFILFEIFFMIYFSVEIVIRFFAYKSKADCIRDRWFVFDGLLVFMMLLENLVIETFVKPNTGGESPVAGASSLRLLRILRITRMTRLMRTFPELMTIIKGLAASVRSVLWTGVILFLLTYTWAVLFTSEFHQGRPTDQEILDCAGNESVEPDEIIDSLGVSPNTCNVQVFFGSMGKSMASLLVMGAVLDDVTACSDSIRKSKSPAFIGFFLLYIVFASFTLLNMLTGILCEVVNATSEGEKVKALRSKLTEAIASIVEGLDDDMDGRITQEEFKKLRKTKRIQDALGELEIDDSVLQKYYEYFFGNKGVESSTASQEERTIEVDEMTKTIMRTRPGMTVSALDLGTVKQAAIETYATIATGIEQLAFLLQGRLGGHGDDTPSPTSPASPPLLLHERHSEDQLQERALDAAKPYSIPSKVFVKLQALSTAQLMTEVEKRLQVAGPRLIDAVDDIKVMQQTQVFEAEFRRKRAAKAKLEDSLDVAHMPTNVVADDVQQTPEATEQQPAPAG